ncbi:hypothetical protein EDB19DRAFT_2034058 [Suillus lakei]|nr:hypothetical protein EDB19DRAFT_2034058 [Suillus lakei]
MTHKSSTEMQKTPPPDYSASSLHTEQDFLEEQVGGGRYQLTPAIKTPMKLRTCIKATNCNGGLVKEASVRWARLVKPTSEDSETLLIDTQDQLQPVPQQASVPLQSVQPVPQQASVPLQLVPQQCSVPAQPVPQQHSVPFQSAPPDRVVPVQDLFYEAPRITPSHSHEPPWPNLFTKPAFVQEEVYNFCGIDFSCLNSNVDGIPIAGPSTMLPAVPHTRIIPPTPPVGDWDMPHSNFIPMDDGSNMAMVMRPIWPWVMENNGCSINNVNHWNAYSSYFKANIQQELKRLGDKAPEGPGMPSVTVRRNCYKLFKKEYPDSWQSVLEYHEEATMLLGAPQTVAMRAQEFHKFGKKISAMMDIAAAHFGFEGALVACGKVVNQDGSLGMTHTTAGAAGIRFWLTHCKSDDDTIIGHLKAQVYNLTSLGVVEEAFKEEVIIAQCNQSEAPTTRECLDISKNGIQWIKQELARQIEQLGGQLSSKRNFPWKTLPVELICLGMVIKGYPEDVLLPGGFHTTTNKGIANLTLKETGIFVAALKAGTIQIKKASKATQAKLVTSEIPILEGKPPAVDCIHAGGRRLFSNGQSDHLGLPHAKLSVAATRQKVPTMKKKAPTTLHTSPISLSNDNDSDDNNSDVNPSTIRPILKPPPSCELNPSTVKPNPSCEFKVVRPPKSQTKDKKDKKKIVKNVKKKVISRVSSEAKLEVTLQASKKRIPPSKASLPKAGHSKSTKGKGKAPAEKRKRPFTVESSDDEEAPDVTAQVIQPAKQLRDGPTDQRIISLTASLQFPNQHNPMTAVNPLVDHNDTDAPDGSDINKAATETHSSNADATNSLPAHPLSPSPPSPTRRDSVDFVPDNIRGESPMPAAQVPIVQPPSLQRGESLGPVQPLPWWNVAINGRPPLGGHPDRGLPPTLAAHHGCSETFMDMPQLHHERCAEMATAPTDRDLNAKNHPMMRAHDADMRPGHTQFTIPCPFSSEASDRLRILQSSVIIPDIVHLELCHSALHLFQSSPVYPFQSAASVQYFAFFTLQLPQTQTLQQLEVFGALSGSAHPILNNY